MIPTHDVSHCIQWRGGKGADSDATQAHVIMAAVAFTERTRKEGRTFECQEELAYALTTPASGGRSHSRQIATAWGVRRLTPRECERLQGFPDDHTRWGTDKDGNPVEISDTQRYRMLGNAVTTTVARWIGERIVQGLKTQLGR